MEKIMKQVEVNDSEEDRLSNLPEEIITHILSFLSTKASVRTSILSTCWKYIWSFVPTLDLSCWDFPSKALRDNQYFPDLDTFWNFLDRVLMGHSLHFLENVCIGGSDLCCHDGSRLESWICAAIKRNVRKLQLQYLYAKGTCELHQSLFNCNNALVVLKLDANMVLNFPMKSPCFPNLKLLELESVIFKDDISAQNLILSCPVLEDLVIWRSWHDNLRTLNVTSQPLKKFVLKYAVDYEDRPGQIIVIDAPALESLDIELIGMTHEYVVRNLSSIITAKIHSSSLDFLHAESYGTRVFEFIKRIYEVKFLHLSCCIMHLLALRSSCTLPTFHNLTYLEFVDDACCWWKWKGVMDVLKSSPILEVLTFDDVNFELEERETTRDWEVVPNCLISHLKTIKIKGGICQESVEQVWYFLKNAKVLERLIIENDCDEDLKKMKIEYEEILKHRGGSMTQLNRGLVISFI